MTLTTIFGLIAGVLTTIRLLPQVHKSLKLKETKDLSSAFVIILIFQAVFLILYGLTKPDNLIVGMNTIPLLCSFMLLHLKIKYK
jgi:MtN3 and saliva related transmembrane protein